MSEIPSAGLPLPLGRRERKKREVRARIYSAARELFRKQGFDATTVDEIAHVADVAPATLFNHFQSKQALLALMTGEVVDHLHAMTVESLGGGGTAIERLSRFVERAARDIAENRDPARETLLEFIRLDGTPSGPHPYLERLFEPFVALMSEGQREGAIRRDHGPTFLSRMVVGMLNSTVTSWLADPDYPIEEGLREAGRFAIETLRPR